MWGGGGGGPELDADVGRSFRGVGDEAGFFMVDVVGGVGEVGEGGEALEDGEEGVADGVGESFFVEDAAVK